MQTIGDRIWYRIHAFVLEKIAENDAEKGFTSSMLDASHVSGGANPLLTHSATGHTAATLGNILYAAAAGVWTLLAGNTTTTRKFLRQTGTGAVSAAPAWDTLVDGDLPTTLAGKTLTTATLTAPTIADFTNAQHDHGDADDGGAVVGGGAHPDLATHDTLGLATQTELDTHAGAADPHTGYRLESADHSHVSSGLQGGPVSHLDLTGIDQADTPTHIPIDAFDDGDMITFVAGAIDVVASGSEGQVLTADPDGIPEWADAASVTLGAYKTTDQEVTSTTLATDSQLTVTMAANTKYQFCFVLFFLNDGAAEGVKVSIDNDGGLSTVSMLAQVSIYDDTANSLVAFARITALGGAGVGAGISAGSNHAIIEGAIETGSGGGAAFYLRFAQNATGLSAGVHCEVGSSMTVSRLG